VTRMTHVRGISHETVPHHDVAARRWPVRPSALRATLALIAMCVAAACGGGGDTSTPNTPNAPSGTLSPAARAYLTELVAVMQEHSLNRTKIDWNAFRTSVMTAAGAAQSVEQTFPAIRTALELLGDGRSVYRPVTGTPISVARSCAVPSASSPTLPGTVGYVRVGAFNGSAAEATAFANALQGAIAAADRDGLAGWIVDVRGNGGGNMWPMLAGVGPVLGTGRVGHFVDALGAASAWEYRDGGSWLSGVLLQAVDTPYRLHQESPRVAVLIDGATAGSGEAVAIAFQRRPETRSFGTATCGLSSAGQQFTMSDGALLIVTVSVMADRTRAGNGAQIVPDEPVTDPREAEQRAVAWLTAR